MFYKSNSLNIKPVNDKYQQIDSVETLFNYLSKLWCKETCAPRMRDKWCEDNKTLGQCSITAFLAQDIFGGEVYGIPLGDGNFHCYNYVNGLIFDLTSSQFNKKLVYDLKNPQDRETHFKKSEKKERYKNLKNKLDNALK